MSRYSRYEDRLRTPDFLVSELQASSGIGCEKKRRCTLNMTVGLLRTMTRIKLRYE